MNQSESIVVREVLCMQKLLKNSKNGS